MELQGIEQSVAQTIAESDLSDLSVSLIDAGIEAATGSPIPVVGTLARLYQTAQSVTNRYYMKKVIAYLQEFSDLPAAERKARFDEALPSPAEKERFGEHIVLVLDRLNDMSKAALMGKVTRAFLQGEVTLEETKSLNLLIDAVDPQLLVRLKDYPRWFSREEQQSLASSGMVRFSIEARFDELKEANIGGLGGDIGTTQIVNSVELKYELSRIGRRLIEVCFSDQDAPD